MLSSGMQCYHLELMLSSGTTCYHLGPHVIIWDEMLSSGMQYYNLEPMLSSGTKCYHLEPMLSSGANVIIWCYHVMLSSVMITHPFFIFPENFTHSYLVLMLLQTRLLSRWTIPLKRYCDENFKG
jgi:hypothetical protein